VRESARGREEETDENEITRKAGTYYGTVNYMVQFVSLDTFIEGERERTHDRRNIKR